MASALENRIALLRSQLQVLEARLERERVGSREFLITLRYSTSNEEWSFANPERIPTEVETHLHDSMDRLAKMLSFDADAESLTLESVVEVDQTP